MRSRKLIFILSLLINTGCVSSFVQNPKPNDLAGKWESIGPLGYYQLVFKENGTGILAITLDVKTTNLYTVSQYKSLKNAFEIKVSSIDSSVKMFMKGRLLLNRLSLESNGKPIWFVQAGDINIYKESSNNAIRKYRINPTNM